MAAFLQRQGFALAARVFEEDECKWIIDMYAADDLFRKTISMQRYRFGQGEYKYLQYPLPAPVQKCRTFFYSQLFELANEWNRQLNIGFRYPPSLSEFLSICSAHQQKLPTPLVLKYGEGGYNTLHQDMYGSIYFPLQAVVFLNEPGRDYSGGEFIITEQVPRAQSKAISLLPSCGDVLFFTTNSRPQKGKRGFYRVQMKHGVSTIHRGERHTLGIIFHDAL